MARFLRVAGWMLVASGTLVLLYVVYELWFTGFEGKREQRDLARQWDSLVAASPDPAGAGDEDVAEGSRRTEPPGSGKPTDPLDAAAADAADVQAALWFERAGRRIVHADTLYVVGDVGFADLRRGPGHYPESDVPGGPGNAAIAGHRTTYGSPFWSLDDLGPGDTIHVADRSGRTWVYEFHSSAVVDPTDTWVVGPDPLGTGTPTLTLTTCHPRFSSAQRLIVWGELVGEA